MKRSRKLLLVVVVALAVVGAAANWTPSVADTPPDVAHGTMPPPPIPSYV